MEFDEEVKHVAMKHARLSEENVWPAAREQPDEETVSPAFIDTSAATRMTVADDLGIVSSAALTSALNQIKPFMKPIVRFLRSKNRACLCVIPHR